MYQVRKTDEGWQIRAQERIVCTVPTEREARMVIAILQADATCEITGMLAH